MKTSETKISPLRQRMIEDMNMRKFKAHTQTDYIRAVKKLAEFLGKPITSATKEDMRRFQLHLAETRTAPGTINTTISGVRFLFQVSLDDREVVRPLSHVPQPRKLPVVLTVEEVTRLIDAATPKYQAAFSIAYGAGLRISEIVVLKTSDIDSERMCIHVEQGKGSKDRYALLSPVLLEKLRDWWRYGKAHHYLLKGGWLFPGQNPINPMSTRTLSRVCLAAAHDAGIEKRVTMHLLRHSFATHLLEQKVDIRVIQVLLGHSKLETTSIYTHVATDLLSKVISPLDSVKSLNPLA
ncbi:MAG: site-specific integrase [gamma proteobacterium symbiont of Bathyaustriella thionipta]|nr:site-specific integrase [gamma proteobacterium symbiont of Bathyaustriella thionipta]MCU7951203.1 site-specific integrase [gamma proteobacterium symbiont of Bathyaustriella thionipta]MCU7954160.1 site-specific integrase [gamma proteobacterium symbiont of Bathyaustriella thionipta]MCU7957718.1 site-specific integrase [gamma proteobacterium symbiont of Bathyaustriella thionipta]MCU7965733.1 site-specific integrase [gamma proteobacterium symbiont of Bathyaustriella thionipta]